MNNVQIAPDARQTREWGKYLEEIGWKSELVGRTYVFIKRLPILGASIIKIQHPIGPIPFTKIDEVAKKHRAMWSVIEPHIYKYDEKEFIKNGYRKSKILFAHSSTIKIDLMQSEQTLFKSFSENARRNIRKSQKENLEIRAFPMKEKKNWKYFDIFYVLLQNVAKMKKFYVPSKEEYRHKMNAFREGSYLSFAYEKDIPIAVVWYACFGNVIAYFQTGITKRGYETLANYLLVWEGLRLGKKLGQSVFDFESIYDERFPHIVPGYKKYTEFKKRFHGEIIKYPQPWIKTYSLLGKLLYFLER